MFKHFAVLRVAASQHHENASNGHAVFIFNFQIGKNSDEVLVWLSA